MSRIKTIVLFFLLNSPFWLLYVFWDHGLRLATVILSLVAMWSLWTARRERKHLWTSKTRDIWMVQFLWCVAATESNAEWFYRTNARPSVAILLVVGILLLTIKGVFNGEKYTIDQS